MSDFRFLRSHERGEVQEQLKRARREEELALAEIRHIRDYPHEYGEDSFPTKAYWVEKARDAGAEIKLIEWLLRSNRWANAEVMRKMREIYRRQLVEMENATL